MKFFGFLGSLVWPLILFLIILVLYFFGILSGYWTLMFAVIFLAVGFVIGFLITGTGEEKPKFGLFLILLGGLLILIIYFFSK